MAKLRQRALFDEPAEPPVEASGVCARVVFNRPMRTIYTYATPSAIAADLEPGKRVLAPFGKGNHRTTGFCVGVESAAQGNGKLKFLAGVVDERPLLSPPMLELTRWIADRYYCSWGQVLDAVVPAPVKSQSGTRWTVLLSPADESGRSSEKLSSKQERAFEALAALGKPTSIADLARAARCGPDCVKALISKGWVQVKRERVSQLVPTSARVLWQKPLDLNADQEAALDPIVKAARSGMHKTFLLHGVTGSGKTEVYLQAIADVVRREKEAIVLVPEISLTPQTIQRFRERFDSVAVLHSQLSPVERNWHWRRIVAGEVQVVVGARSAIFAPCPKLGLIVIDEEHETTFKQDVVPRYHARDVARRRAEIERVPLVLGSATPSLESWMECRSKRFELLTLPRRVANLAMPRVDLIDLRDDYHKSRSLRALSQPLRHAMKQTIEAGGQVILFLNRRGFSTAVLCPDCGHVEQCRHCEIALTYHRDIGRLVCHACDAEFEQPQRCGKCGTFAIRYAGVGTERLEEEVRAAFPGVKSERMDSDTMQSVARYEKVLDDFRRGEIKILLGTQMIAKGLDFPNVRLVGVVSADTARNLPDFRASERTFQLIAQVAGRTGRGDAPGRVLVQTFNPTDPSVLAASKHDYHQFVRHEVEIRKQFGYPPFCLLSRIIVRSKNEAAAKDAVHDLARRLQQAASSNREIRILGPAPAPLVRVNDFFRFHVQLHVPNEDVRSQVLGAALENYEAPTDVEWTIDVDPVNMQ